MDEAISVAKAISNSDARSVLFAMLPVAHAGTDKFTVLKNKRTVEDAIMEPLVESSFFDPTQEHGRGDCEPDVC